MLEYERLGIKIKLYWKSLKAMIEEREENWRKYWRQWLKKICIFTDVLCNIRILLWKNSRLLEDRESVCLYIYIPSNAKNVAQSRVNRIFFNRKVRVTRHCLYRDSLTLKKEICFQFAAILPHSKSIQLSLVNFYGLT